MKHVIQMVMIALLGIVTQAAQAGDSCWKGCKGGHTYKERTVDGTSLIRDAHHATVIDRMNLQPVLATKEGTPRTACNSRTGNLLPFQNGAYEKTAQACFFHIDHAHHQLVRALYTQESKGYLQSLYLKDARECGNNLDRCAADNSGWVLRIKYTRDANYDPNKAQESIYVFYDSAKDGNRYAQKSLLPRLTW